MTPHVIDLGHAGVPGAIAAVILTDPAPTVVDPGPGSTLPALIRGLEALGLDLPDLRRVVLTHIHLDHAGGTGALVRANPEITVHVHEDGGVHLVDPERLVRSTRRTFGDRSDALWGETVPVPRSAIRGWTPRDAAPIDGLRVLPSPGHIDHHLAFQVESDGTLLAGDAMGIVLTEDGPVHPPTPPPSLDFSAWDETLERWASLDVPAFVATHFGLHRRFHDRRLELRERLRSLESRVQAALDAGVDGAAAYGAEVVERMSRGGDEARVRRYFETFPADTEWRGAEFHLRRRDTRET